MSAVREIVELPVHVPVVRSVDRAARQQLAALSIPAILPPSAPEWRDLLDRLSSILHTSVAITERVGPTCVLRGAAVATRQPPADDALQALLHGTIGTRGVRLVADDATGAWTVLPLT